MNTYTEMRKSGIRKLSWLWWAVSILLILLDTFLNAAQKPPWMQETNYALLGALLVMLIFLRPMHRYTTRAFIVYIYVYTLFVYLSVFIGPAAVEPELLTSTTRIGACLVYVPLMTTMGRKWHTIAIGLLNIGCIAGILANSRLNTGIDPVTIVLLMVIGVVFFAYDQITSRSMEDYSQSALTGEENVTQFLSKQLEQESKRSSFLDLFMHEFLKVMQQMLQIANQGEQCTDQTLHVQLWKIIKRTCQHERSKISGNENVVWYTETDSAFVSWLKLNFPNLKSKEILMCYLIQIGHQSKELADKLNLSIETTKTYRKQIRKKLDVQNDQDLAHFLDEHYKNFIDNKLDQIRHIDDETMPSDEAG